ncbi:hypothetical protein T439DRAFT_323769 [Meredithblackwellia eburnea MCA 4105]
MPGKRAANRPPPSKAGRVKPGKPSGKARSAAHPKPKNYNSTSVKNHSKAQKDAQKARDKSSRDDMNALSADAELRRAMGIGLAANTQQPPKELQQGGASLAGILGSLEMM